MILYQVNNMLLKPNFLRLFCRCVHTEKGCSNLYPLESRRLLNISGVDSANFLQGLITNDMTHFEDGSKSIYTMFLNNKGRVLYDTLIYKWEENSFMIECDKTIFESLVKHLKLYKLKRAINFNFVHEDLKVWALITSKNNIPNTETDPTSDVNICKDPRLNELGHRIIAHTTLTGNKIAEKIGDGIATEECEDGYTYTRYKLGVSEGAKDLLPGTCFPLEVNCDYLHGVSFHKGCYIGQEMTARVHHTGVVRKRIMSLKFETDVKEDLEHDTAITHTNKPNTNLGKLKGFIRNYGIGLVRIREALDAKELMIGSHKVQPLKPNWWPKEAPKEKLSLKTE